MQPDEAGDSPPAPAESEPRGETALPRAPLGRPGWRHTLAVVLICAGVYMPTLGSFGMFDPWETHYTEVARQFMVRGDWLSTWWQNGTGPEGLSETNFWSKPVGSFWLSGLSLRLFGYDGQTTGEQITMGRIEWAVRLPFFLCALFGIYCSFLMVSRLFGRRAGLLSAIVMATAPMYFMIGRQAMTDMPYVGLMSGGIALLALAIFGEREELPRRTLRLGKRSLSWPHAPSYYFFLLAFLGVLALLMLAIVPALLRVPLAFTLGGRQVSGALVMLVYAVLAAIVVWMSRKTQTRNELYLYGFYMAIAYAGVAKGLIGSLQPGLVFLVYLLASREWRVLADLALMRGILIALCVFAPWYHGMVTRYGQAFWNELFGTEQFRRLTIGEQSQAKGTFEYYVGQLGYGLFPWIAFLPGALVRGFLLPHREGRSAQDRARLFIYVWFVTAIALFTLTLTKYHHYILPAIPPAAILIGIYLDDLIEQRARGLWASLILAGGLLAMVALDLVKQPAQWVWMYTYLYGGNWGDGAPAAGPILLYAALSGGALLLYFVPRLRKVAVWGTVAVALTVGAYTLNWYQVKCGPHWSQKKVLQTYYKLRRSPEDQLIAWQFNWRGETWYTAAKVVVSKSLDNAAITQWLKERPNRRFFFITERGRYGSLSSILPSDRGRQTLRIVDDSNVHYVLAMADI